MNPTSPPAGPPRALARLQFHPGFTLDDAADRVGYYADLGVSHLYASPLFTARPGSSHGYDVIDYHHVNPELGGEPALRRLVGRLRAHRMGLVLDIVPNHMFAGPGNAWWIDVLRHGRASRYATYFDIDWRSPDPLVRGHVLLPILGKPYAQALRDGDIRLARDGEGFALRVHDNPLPLSPATVEALRGAGQPAAVLAAHDAACEPGFRQLHALLEQQHYRLALWKLANDMVDYRRFFDINELAGLRMDRTRVFEDAHALVFRLYAEGLVDGLRVDHVDGLADPHRYCRQLRHRLRRLQGQRPADAPRGPAYVVVEKILAEDERLRPDWRMDGTTGYEFMDQVGALLHDGAGEGMLTELWQAISGERADFAAVARAARRQIVVDSFEAELDRTARSLFDAARADVDTRDVSLPAIRRVLVELLVHFPVYRTYAGGLGRDAVDEAVFQQAYSRARRHVRIEDRELLADVAAWLGGQAPRGLPPGRVRQARERAMRIFQQATSPMAAKAVEDTACYRYGRLLSRNEVGADPGHLALDIPSFHALCAERARDCPHNLLATATHDHKRGEDARARLAVLSQAAVVPHWASTVTRWRERNAPLRLPVDDAPAPSAADEYMLYQTLVGAWPLTLAPDDSAGLDAFLERIAQWQRKAVREAKRSTRWSLPNEPYEDACEAFLAALLAPGNDFAGELHAFVQRIAAAGAANSLLQTTLRLTTPGVPDTYQGTEFWDFSLVDPDNRRPVDFDARTRALADVPPWRELVRGWHDGGLKQRVVRELLQLRMRHPDVFARGGYRALAVDQPNDRLLAFERGLDGDAIIVLALRHTAGLLLDVREPRWDAAASAALLPPVLRVRGLSPGRYRNLLGEGDAVVGEVLDPADWLTTLPVAVLERVAA
ncbi:malto-oligosyltrehalose synthase [Frateuria sp. STR12]|uniref:malto-oligosyltrehalose synthase n=1 Tax=Frateuria hangzhouensis TaxID=2995589 RepID=UPI002260C1DC|nr:malto-oligosyltrehalose synthase [Frateuria sp. STR12]MCX7512193.1 malto-oligosyltrehalose synthase [Frateuria sp. STR12]